MGALLKIYTCIFVQFLANFSCGKTVWMRLKASPALKGLIRKSKYYMWDFMLVSVVYFCCRLLTLLTVMQLLWQKGLIVMSSSWQLRASCNWFKGTVLHMSYFKIAVDIAIIILSKFWWIIQCHYWNFKIVGFLIQQLLFAKTSHIHSVQN